MSIDSATSTSAHGPGLSISLSCERESFMVADETVTILYLAGEIDMCTNPQLDDALVELLGQRAAHILIDLSRVGFCGIGGFALLADAARAVEADGRQVALVAPSPRHTRTWALLWPDHRIPRHDTVAAATAAIRAR